MTLPDSLAGAAWLTGGPVARLFGVLDSDGEEARVVGGAVRDALIDRPVGEIDIATTASPEEIVRRAARAKIRTIPTGIDHGTVTLMVEGKPFEVTTLREDVETFGRKAKVAFGRSWEHDAQRRDFTINALSVSREGRVHDYVGGLADLSARRVRFIGDASTRIAEDYLRILRFFRFHASFGEGAPDAEALAACIDAREGLDTLSRERVRMELLKLLVARRAPEAAAVMAEIGLLTRILGGVALVPQLTRMAQIERGLAWEPDAVRRLGALAVLVTEDAERLFQRLRLSNAEFQRLSSMADGWWRIAKEMPARGARALLYRLGAEAYLDRTLIAFSRAQEPADNASWRALADFPQRWNLPKFPVAAADFVALGVARGPGLGAALRKAEEAWIGADFPSSPSEIAEIVQSAASAAEQK
ncbi:MAG: CCA tRNA nucleotidyltransferase [Pseudorhodoplanes sp.]